MTATATWTYDQATGALRDEAGALVETCYSGNGAGVNNPAMEAVRMVGPIPRGRYKVGVLQDHPRLGKNVFRLTPVGHDSLGRDEFYGHGDNKKRNRSASHGCIIMSLATRLRCAKEAKFLEVV